jgi:hypothetical protein
VERLCVSPHRNDCRTFGSKFLGKVGLLRCVLEQLCDYDATSGVDEQ